MSHKKKLGFIHNTSIVLLAFGCTLGVTALAQDEIQLDNINPPPLPETSQFIEAELELPSDALVQSALLSGPYHQVNPMAKVSGHIARFDINTRWGLLQADGVEMLSVRIEELPVVQQLHDVKMAKVFAKSAKDSAKDTVSSVAQVLMNPKDTITGLPKGVVRFFKREFNSTRNDLVKAGDDVRRDVVDKDKRVKAGLPMQPEAVQANETKDKHWQDKAQKRSKKLALRYLGYNKARRAYAQKLGVDPYSKNPFIVERLDKIGWAAWSGSRSTQLAFDSVGGIAASVMSESKRLNDIVWREDPIKVSEFNFGRLQDYECGGHEARDFLTNGAFSASLQSNLVDEFLKLKPTKGCEDFFTMASFLKSELEARYLINGLRLSNHFYAEQKGRKRLKFVGSGFVLDTGRDVIIMPLPLDFLQWTAETEFYFDLPEFRRYDKTLLISGQASQRAREELTERGWSIVERVPYDGAPPYAQ